MDQLRTGEDPTHIGAYRLIARLGAGGMGLVYLGRSEGGRTVAVKVVQAEHAGHPEFRRRFAREVAAARRVGGDWTAAVLDADPEAAVPWVATQYIPGPDLTTVVAEDFGPLPEHSVRVLANRLALALRAVHDAGLIHRDLKPSNVLVTVDGPRVIDFGIARAMDSLGGDSLHTRTGMLIGSPGFMSPEQVRGLELTPASDVFCLGAVLVYAATGRLLFGATDTGLSAHLFKIAEDEPDLTGVPGTLLPLVRECLQKDPALRPTPQQIAELTVTDGSEEWLPGAVLAQLGRHAARLLDYAPTDAAVRPPATVPDVPSDPRIDLAKDAAPLPPAYAPTAPAAFVPPQGFGPPAAYPYPHPDTPGADPKRRRALVVAALAQLSVLFAASTFNVGAPSVHMDLGIGSFNPLLGLYAVAFGGLLLLGGHLADVVGGRRMLTIGLAGFIAATVVVGFVPDSTMMLVVRGLQGASAALVTSAGLSLVVGGFTDPKERGRAFGVYATAAVGGTPLGLALGGLLIETMAWRIALLSVVPFAVVALILARTLPVDGPNRVPFDMGGTLLGGAGLLALTYGLTLDGFGTGAREWASPLTLIPTVAGIGLLGGFLVRQFTVPGGLAVASGVRTADRVGGLVGLVMLGVAVIVTFESLSIHLQHALGLAPLAAGVALLPMAVALALGCFMAARLAHRVPQRVPVAGGLVAAALGLAFLSRLNAGSGGYLAWVLPGLIVVGLGVGLAFGPLLDTATAGVALPFAGSAAATALAAQGLGETIGGALLASSSPVLSEPDENGYYSLLGPDTAPLWWAAGALLIAALVASATLTKRPSADAIR